jgi:pimeloyl-ACP methyl ester carboxylesterase
VPERFITNSAADPMEPVPLPPLLPMKEGIASLSNGARLWYADSQIGDEVAIFLHGAPGADPRSWGYQQKAFIEAGYRVIFYARRGYLASEPNPRQEPGIAADDLNAFADFLGPEKFHLISNAGGGAIAADYALSYPERLHTVTIANNYAGVRKGYIRQAAERCHPPQWTSLPRWFRNFSSSYRVANPDGVEKFHALEEKASESAGPPYGTNHVIDEMLLETIRLPVLLITGDADLSTPPALMRMVASHIRDHELAIIAECGHSPQWEQPLLFNQTVLDFLRRNRAT